MNNLTEYGHIDWGIGGLPEHLGIPRNNPTMVMRLYDARAASTEDVDDAFGDAATEFQRLRDCSVRVLPSAHTPWQMHDGTWGALVHVPRLEGETAEATYPPHWPLLIKLGRRLLRYYSATEVGQPFLTGIATLDQYTVGHVYRHQAPNDIFLHDVDPRVKCRGESDYPISNKEVFARSITELRAWLGRLPTGRERDELMEQAEVL